MHEKLMHQSRKNMESSVIAASWTSKLAEGLESQARDVGYDGRLSPCCLEELQTFLAGLLEARHRHMASTLEDRKSVHDFAKLHRDRRDELTQEVYDQLVKLRVVIRGLLGKSQERKLFGAGQKTPREPRELARVAQNVISFLGHPDVQEGLCLGLANEDLWAAVVEKMAEPLGELWQVLHELAVMDSDERAAVRRLHAAKDALHQTQLRVFRIQENLLELAGCDSLADDLRPAEPTRRRSRNDRAEPVGTHQIVDTAAAKPEDVAENAPESAPRTLPTGSHPSRAVLEDPESVEATASPGTSSASPPDVESHPVRKVLKWIQAVPHRVRHVPETPETAGSAERAA